MAMNEEPIILMITRFGDRELPVSHAALRYKGQSLSYGPEGFGAGSSVSGTFYYRIYPSEVGINPQKLEQAIQQRKKNIKGQDYNYFTNNCADQVIAVLKEAGAKNISQPLGISVPSIPVLDDLEDWAKANGHIVRRGTYIRQRKKDALEYKKCMDILVNPEAYRAKIKKEYQQKKARGNLWEKAKATKEYFEEYLFSRQPKEALMIRAAELNGKYRDDTFFQALTLSKTKMAETKLPRETLKKMQEIFRQTEEALFSRAEPNLKQNPNIQDSSIKRSSVLKYMPRFSNSDRL